MIDLNLKVCQSKEIEATDLNGEKVMMNLDLGKYFALNPVGSRIWDIMKEEVCVSEIVEILLNEYDVSQKQCEESVIKYLGILKDENLIEIC